MISITEIVESKGYKNFMKYVYGFGAAVVLVGALFKIQHYPGAAFMLVVGLLTEALIFFFSAFEPLHEELDWTLVYPELAGLSDEFDDEDHDQVRRFERASDMPQVVGVPVGGNIVGGGVSEGQTQQVTGTSASAAGTIVVGGGSTAALAKFDKMLEEAEIEPETFKKMGEGIAKLSQTAKDLNDLSDAGLATKDFVSKMQAATESASVLDDTYKKTSEVLKESVNELSSSYTQTAESFNIVNKELSEAYTNFANTLTKEINSIGTEGTAYAEKLSSLNSNLSTLNAVYELQIQNTNEQVESSKKYFEEINGVANNMTKIVENTSKLNVEVEQLEQNIASLNNIYGNMLSSVNIK